MYIVNGIAFAGESSDTLLVKEVKPLDDLMMIVTFSTGEQRLFDATRMLEYPAFQILTDESVFKAAKVEYGVVTWNDGDVDIAPEMMYKMSYAYDAVVA